MKIGIDAYYLYSEKIDGIGNYLLRLMTGLSKIDKSNVYYLYTPGVKQKDFSDSIFSNPNFHLVTVPGILTKRRRLWLQSPSLRRQIIRDSIDLFVGGGEYFPLFLPDNILAASTIHDVAFKVMPGAISLTNRIFYDLLIPILIKRADLFFTVSHHSMNEMRSHLNTGNKKIYVIYNGIDCDKFSQVSNNGKKGYILFVGTMQPRKNLANLLKAYALAAGSIGEDLVVVGASSWKNSELRNIVESMPEAIQKRIFFKGYVSGDELLKLYREAKLFTLLSLHEGFGLPILEAMASGTAVLTSRMTAIPEIYLDAVEYADPFSPEDISNKIIFLLNNDNLRMDLQKRGLALSKNYDVRIQAQKYVEAFSEISKTLEDKR